MPIEKAGLSLYSGFGKEKTMPNKPSPTGQLMSAAVVLVILMAGCGSPLPTNQLQIEISTENAFGRSLSVTGTYYPAYVDNAPLIIISDFYDLNYWEQQGYVRWLTNNEVLSLSEDENQSADFPLLPSGSAFGLFVFSAKGHSFSGPDLVAIHSAALEEAQKLPGINKNSIIVIDVGSDFLYNACPKIESRGSGPTRCDGALVVFSPNADKINHFWFSGFSGRPLWCAGLDEPSGYACAPCESGPCNSANYADSETFFKDHLASYLYDFLTQIIATSQNE
jgi:hypothetical protein